MLVIQSTNMGILQQIVHDEIIVWDMWTSFISLFSVENNA